MLRTAALRASRPALRQSSGAVGAQRRAASSVSETASKMKEQVKDAAGSMNPSHHKPSSDVPWAVGSLLVFAPLLFYMTSPPSVNKDTHHLPAAKEKFKPHLRLPPDAEAKHFDIPEEYGDKAGEGRPLGDGDHGLRAEQHESDDVVKRQASPEPAKSASNHDAKGGLKGDSQKFMAAARGSQQLNQMGGAEASHDMKAVNKAIREASAEDSKDEGAFKDITTPGNTSEKMGEALTEQRAKKGPEDDKKDTGEQKDEQL